MKKLIKNSNPFSNKVKGSFKLLSMAIVILSVASCEKFGFCRKENGDITSRSFAASQFNSIELDIKGTVYYTQGNSYGIEVETSSNLMDLLKFKFSGEKLKITTKSGYCLIGNPHLKIYVTAPNINTLKTTGKGLIKVPGIINVSELSLETTGSGSIEVDSLICNVLRTETTGSGSINVSSISTIGLLNSKITGSGDINMFNAPIDNAEIEISGSGSTRVHVISQLFAKITGSGDVIYQGNPLITAEITGSGMVKPF